MGCDIHLFPEKKRRYGWHLAYRHVPLEPEDFSYDTFPSPDRRNYFGWEDRWYWLFGQLAGVRSGAAPIAQPRGIPEGVDDLTVSPFLESWGRDLHSHSWLLLSELSAHPWEEVAETPEDAQLVRDWLDRLAEIDPDLEKVRVVFAFDN